MKQFVRNKTNDTSVGTRSCGRLHSWASPAGTDSYKNHRIIFHGIARFNLHFTMSVFLMVFLFLTSTVASYGQDVAAGYNGIPWNSRFPVIEEQFPKVSFDEEDSYHVTLFSVKRPKPEFDRIIFKLFEEQLISVAHYYTGSIDHLQNDAFVNGLLGNPGEKLEVRKTTSNSLAGIATVLIWEYRDVLILFRSYPPGQKEGFIKKENSIVFIYKPTFDKMVYYRKNSLGDNDHQVVDYDYIEF